MSDAVSKKTFSPEDDARDASKWRELCSKVAHCLGESPNGYADIWGGDENLMVSVLYQSKGRSGMELRLTWTADNEVREDLNSAMRVTVPPGIS